MEFTKETNFSTKNGPSDSSQPLLPRNSPPRTQMICQQIPYGTWTMTLVCTGGFNASVLHSFSPSETFQRVKTWIKKSWADMSHSEFVPLRGKQKNSQQVESKKEMTEVGTCCVKASGRLMSVVTHSCHACVTCVNGYFIGSWWITCDGMELFCWFTLESSPLVWGRGSFDIWGCTK